MDTRFQDNAAANVHLGHNIQRIREIIGYKQITLAEMVKLSQQSISKWEQSKEIPDDILEKLAEGLGVTAEFVKNFKEEKAIYNIQSNIKYEGNSSNNSQAYYPVINNHPIDKVVELFEKLLKNETEKVELLTNATKALKDLADQINKLKG